jgi:UDP:flavonoid glycosyltransferase YjiC (YdhE family)
MRVLLVMSGSMGDVAPYTVSVCACTTPGHDVTIATHAPFAEVVTRAGLAFHPIAGDPGELLERAPGRPAAAPAPTRVPWPGCCAWSAR